MVAGVQILAKNQPKVAKEILTEDALTFLAALHRTFDATRQDLLNAREVAQQRYDSGVALDFPQETAHIRNEPSWICAPPAPGLEDRRVEITGPPDRKMVINALNSGAKTFMADFEGTYETCLNLLFFPYTAFISLVLSRLMPPSLSSDSCSPTFANLVNGQANLRDAIRREIDFETGGKSYRLSENPAVLIVR